MIRMDFSGKTAIVTGANRGIGQAIARRLLEGGAEVIITSTHDRPPLWIKKYRCFRHIRLDFLNPYSAKEFYNSVSKLKKADILVNNAGIQIPQSIENISDASWDKIIAVNLSGPMQLMRCVAPIMKRRKYGRILNVSSISGIASKPGSASYSTSKSGLIGLTRAAALDLASCGILVNALCPGYTQTEMIRAVPARQRKAFLDAVPLGRFCRPEELAEFAAFLCSDLNSYITGQAVIVDGGTLIQ